MSIGFQGLLLAFVFLDLPVNLQKHNGRCKDAPWGILDNISAVMVGLGSLAEVFYPACGINENQRASPSSRSSLLVVPAAIPFSSFNGRIGMR
jgi:hypothetical protein